MFKEKIIYSELFQENYGTGKASAKYIYKIFKDHGLLNEYGNREVIEDFISQFGRKDYYQLDAEFQMFLGY